MGRGCMPGSSEWPKGRAGVGWDGCRLGQGSAWRQVGDGRRRGEAYGVRVCWLVTLWPGAAARSCSCDAKNGHLVRVRLADDVRVCRELRLQCTHVRPIAMMFNFKTSGRCPRSLDDDCTRRHAHTARTPVVGFIVEASTFKKGAIDRCRHGQVSSDAGGRRAGNRRPECGRRGR